MVKLLALLPLLTGVVLAASIISSYVFVMTTTEGFHPIPYPSDLGVNQPERGMFTAGLSFSGAMNFFVVYVRYIQVNDFYPQQSCLMNKFALLFGVLMTAGQCLVPAYSLIENRMVHYIGAALYFGGATLYMLVQAYLSRRYRYTHSACIKALRFCCAILGLLCVLAYAFARLFAPREKHRYRIPHIAEWLLAVTVIVFTCSFSWDFQRLQVKVNSYELMQKSLKKSGNDKTRIYNSESQF